LEGAALGSGQFGFNAVLSAGADVADGQAAADGRGELALALRDVGEAPMEVAGQV